MTAHPKECMGADAVIRWLKQDEPQPILTEFRICLACKALVEKAINEMDEEDKPILEGGQK